MISTAANMLIDEHRCTTGLNRNFANRIHILPWYSELIRCSYTVRRSRRSVKYEAITQLPPSANDTKSNSEVMRLVVYSCDLVRLSLIGFGQTN